MFVRLCALVLKFFGQFLFDKHILVSVLLLCYISFFPDYLLWMSIVVICIVYLHYCLFVL